MARTLQQNFSISSNVGASTTMYSPGGCGAPTNWDATETNRQVRYRDVGVLSNLYINVLTNDRGASTYRLRKNAANGNMVAAIPASTTGEFEDTVNTDATASADEINTQLVTGAGGTTFTANLVQTLFASTVGTTKRRTNFANSITNNTQYSPYSGFASSGVESSTVVKAPFALTIKNLILSVSANTRDGATTLVNRINSVDGTLNLSVPAATTGVFEDLVNSDAVAATNLINLVGRRAGAAGVITTLYSGVSITTTNSGFSLISTGLSIINAGVTTQYSIEGFLIEEATELNTRGDANLSLKLSKLSTNVSANTVSGNSTLRLRKNGANVNQVVTITSLTTGIFEDTTNTDIVTPPDSLNVQLITAGAGTSMTLRSIFMAAAAGGAIKDVIGINMIPWPRT